MLTNNTFVYSRRSVVRLLGRDGIACTYLMLGITLASGMSICIRELGDTFSAFQIVFMRSVVVLFVLSLLTLKTGFDTFVTKRPGLLFIRSIVGVTGQFLAVMAILNLQLAEAQALGFTRNFIVVLLSIWILGESVSSARWLAIFIGFMGVLIILQPGAGMQWESLYAIGSAFCFSISLILTKILLNTHSRQCLMTYASIGQCVLSVVPAIVFWQAIALVDVGWVVLAGFIMLVVNPINLQAYKIGDVNTLSPVEYMRIIVSTMIGFFFFGEIPAVVFWIGVALIVVANILSLKYSRRSRS